MFIMATTKEITYKVLEPFVQSLQVGGYSESVMLAFLNSVMQKALFSEYKIRLTMDFSLVTELHSAKLSVEETEVRIIAFGRTKNHAKYVLAMTLVKLFNVPHHTPQELAGDAGGLAAPTTQEAAPAIAKIEDTTVLALTNPQSVEAAPPMISLTRALLGMSHSVPNHEYQTMQERMHFYGAFQVKATDKRDSVPFQLNIPTDLLNVEGSVGATPYLNHVFNSTAVEFLFKVNPPPNQCGLYVISHLPAPALIVPDMQIIWRNPCSLYQRHGFDIAVLNLGVQNDAVYSVPYEMPTNFIVSEASEDPLSHVRDSSQLFVSCVSPLKTGDADVQVLDVSVWFRFIETNLNGMRYDKTLTSQLQSSQELAGSAQSIQDSAGGVFRWMESIPIFGSIVTLTGHALGEFAAATNEYFGGPPNFRENLEKQGIISGTGKDKGKGDAVLRSGMRPKAEKGSKLTPYSNQCLSNCGSDEFAHRLALTNTVSALQDTGELSLGWLASRPNLLATVKISTSTPRGTVLIKLNQGLLNKPELYQPMASHSANVYAGPLGVIASTMQYYAGKKVYCFQVVKTAFHKLSLAVAGTPYAEVPNNTEAGSQYFKVLDFNDQDFAVYDTPYVDKFGMRVSPLSGISTTDGWPKTGGSYYTDTTPFVGELGVILTNSMTITGNAEVPLVTSEVDLLIWEYMDSGTQFSCPVAPRSELFAYSNTNPPTEAQLIHQPSQTLSGDVEIATRELIFNVPGKTTRDFGVYASVLPQLHSAEIHDNVYMLINRYSYPIQLRDAPLYSIAMTPRSATIVDTSDPGTWSNFSAFSWYYISMFFSYTGSFDFLVVDVDSTTGLNYVAYEPPILIARGPTEKRRVYNSAAGYTFLNGNLSSMFHSQVNPVFSGSVSSFTKTNQVVIHGDLTVSEQQAYPDDNFIKSSGTLLITRAGATKIGENGDFDLFFKPSSDFRLHQFMGVSPMKFAFNAAPPMTRHIRDTNGHREFRRLTPSEFSRIGKAQEAYLTFEYADTPPPSAPPPYDPLLISTVDETTITDGHPFTPNFSTLFGLRQNGKSLQDGSRRTDARQRLLREGVESNPGPVFSTLSGFKDGFSSGVHNLTTKISTAALSPVIQPIDSIRRDVHDVSDSLLKTSSSIDETSKKFNSVATRVDSALESVESIAKDLMETIMSTVKIPDVRSLWQALLHFVHLWVSPTRATLGLSILGIFSALGLVPAALMSVGCVAFERFKNLWSSSPELNPEDNKQTLAGDNDDAWADLASFIISCVSSLLGHKMTAKEGQANLTSGLVLKFPQIWSTTTHLTRFLKNTLVLFKRAFNYVVSLLPGGSDVKFVVENSDLIDKFVDEATLLCNPMNTEALRTQPSLKQRFWTCVMTAYYLRGITAKTPEMKVPGSLSVLIKDVLAKADEFSIQYQCCPVRYEPFVACFVGDSAIGKSYVSQTVITDLLKKTGYRGYDAPIYVRTPGNQYWNGCNAQPAVMYDDFMAVKGPEFSALQLSEMFSLKTTAIFNPPMADLSDKRLRYNPLIVWLNCNDAFPALNSVATPSAVYRRRDCLIAVRVKSEYKPKIGQVFDIRLVPKEVKEKFGHLEFGFYDASDVNVRPKNYMGWEQFQYSIEEKHQAYHRVETEHVKYRLSKLQELLPEQASRLPEGVDPFRLFYEAQIQSAEQSPVQNAPLPSQMVEEVISNNSRLNEVSSTLLSMLERLKEGVKKKANRVDLEQTALQDPGPSDQVMAADEEPAPSALADYEAQQQADIETAPPPFRPFGSEQLDGTAKPFEDSVEVRRRAMKNPGPCGILLSGINWISSKTLGKVHKHACDILSRTVLQHYEGISHEIMCCVCRDRKLCSYRCPSVGVHAVCHECYSHMALTGPPNCPVCRQNTLIQWIKPSDVSFREKATAMLLLATVICTNSVQRLMNWLTENSSVIDIMFLVSLLLIQVGVPLYEYFHTSSMMQQYLNELNNYYHTDYVLERHFNNGVYHYYAVSHSDALNRFILSGDEVFHDAEDPTSVVIKQIVDGVECVIYAQLVDLEPQVMTDQPVVCPHQNVHRNWNYLYDGNYGFWVDVHDADCTVPDQLCPQDCCWDKDTRRSFLRAWAQYHYLEIRDALNPTTKFSNYREVPLEFVPKSSEAPKKFKFVRDWISSLKLKDWWHWLGEKVRKYGKILAIAATVIGTLVATNSLFQYITSTPSGYSSARSIAPTAQKFVQQTRVQQLAGSHEFDNKIRLLYNNMAWFTVPETKPGMQYVVRSLFIRDRWVCMTRHQYLHLLNREAAGADIVLSTVREKVNRKVVLKECRVLGYVDYDLVSIQLSPTHIGAYKSIVPFAYPHEELERAKRSGIILSGEPHSSYSIRTQSVNVTNVHSAITTRDPDQDKHVEFCNLIETKGFSGKNICGTLLLAEDNNNPFMGLYFSSDKSCENGYSYCIPINQKMLLALSPSVISDVSVIAPAPEPMPVEEQTLAGDYRCLGRISRTRVPFQNSKTKIFPSTVHQVLDNKKVFSVTEPCCLSKRDARWSHDKSPLISGCENLCQPKSDFPLDLENLVVKAANIQVLHYAQPLVTDVQTRTVSQAVCGLGIEAYPGIKRDTSVGWPYNLLKSDKKQMIRRDDILHPVLSENGQMVDVKPEPWFLQELDDKRALRSVGIVQPTVFWDHLKDERRKKEKLRRLGGTRIFSLSPLDFLITYRQYTMDYVASWMAAWLDLEHAVGISADGSQWTMLANRLLAKGNNIVCLDYSNFGPGLNVRLAEKLENLSQSWYEKYDTNSTYETDNIIRSVLTTEIISPIHLCDSMLYQTLSGIPSGHPGTTPLNTEVNKAYVKMCWLALAPLEFRTLQSFRNQVALYCYGDDVIMSVSSECISWFNAITIMKWFEKFQVVVTPAMKSGNMQAFVGLEDATFLKRGFLKHPVRIGSYLAPLEWSSVTDCAHWIQGNPNDAEATQVNLDQSLRLAYGHGPEKFDQWKNLLNDIISEKTELVPLLLSWHELDAQFFE